MEDWLEVAFFLAMKTPGLQLRYTPPEYYKYDPKTCTPVITGLYTYFTALLP